MICVGKYAAIDDIKRHIVTVGSKRWAVVQARHPEVSPATFWRYVRAAKGDLAAEDMRVVCEQGVRSHVLIKAADPATSRRLKLMECRGESTTWPPIGSCSPTSGHYANPR